MCCHEKEQGENHGASTQQAHESHGSRALVQTNVCERGVWVGGASRRRAQAHAGPLAKKLGVRNEESLGERQAELHGQGESNSRGERGMLSGGRHS